LTIGYTYFGLSGKVAPKLEDANDIILITATKTPPFKEPLPLTTEVMAGKKPGSPTGGMRQEVVSSKLIMS
jgi:hypothetical protein